ncbi:C-5 sterol desaturase [Endocarpon pusillum Z07020]|uniref:C-5 sterol desaturase n=1 Tax=Endocarpon pusillum (strain Z07020 / HMAS-L-300199) TaxID=1263415 RepID=U1I1K1_ENDPU|nr:C-5 sterol desaturase [Endocarpon pusillum Z07020]ERF75804.1 C-5 sterol desaturase [Endocarpon pusillum Z07020]
MQCGRRFSPPKQPAYAFNATSGVCEIPTALPPTTWQFVPASDYLSFTPRKYACMSQWPRDDWRRQLVTLFLISWCVAHVLHPHPSRNTSNTWARLFAIILYFVFATLSYVFVFDKATLKHPKYLKNQIRLEIRQASIAFPVIAVLTAPLFLLEVRGYSKLYDTTAEGPGLWYNFLQFPLFLCFTDYCFTDYCIYWIHRYLHHPLIYRRLHKPHHKWIMPTPYASHAFHPLDGFAQGFPYHMFPFIFPLQKFAYVVLFIFINFWTIMIHDGEYIADNPIINGAACHTMHHLYFHFNYGQFTTLWDRLGGSYRKPNDELFRKELKMCQTEWSKQVKETEKVVKEIEAEYDRTYRGDEPKKVR